MEFWVIDRWESQWGICHNEQGNRKEIPKSCFPEGAKEGDWFLILEDNSIYISAEETKRRRESAEILRKRLLLRKLNIF